MINLQCPFQYVHFREKCKICQCGLFDTQLASCGIKMNSEISKVCKKKKKKKFTPYSQIPFID